MTCSAALPLSRPMPGARPAQPCAAPCLLPAGQALTLRARRAGVLRIAQGRVWLTFGPAGRRPGWPADDHVLGAGQALALARGDAVVLEAWHVGEAQGAGAAAAFVWTPAAPLGVRPGWLALAQALQDLGRALGAVAGASARLAQAAAARLAGAWPGN